MANERKEKEIDLSQPITLTGQDLLQLFSEMVKQQTQASNAQAEAITKLSPHYVSPEQAAFQEQAREQQRSIEIFKLKNRKRQQRLCEHEQGQTGADRNGKGAFNMLKLSTGETIGVCTYCQMVISSINPDHQKLFRKAAGTMAEAGQLTQYVVDPIKAQLSRLGVDERTRVIAAREKYMSTAAATVDLEDEII